MASEAEAGLAERARVGDAAALGRLLEIHRPHLERLIALRLDRRLRSRLDPADVLQETLMEAFRRIGDWEGGQAMPFRVWLRILARQKVIDAHRRHLDAAARDARREEVELLATSVDAAARFIAHVTSPSSAAARVEDRAVLEATLATLDPMDREILVSRHIEQLTNAEVARELGIEPKAASKRYLRALERLRRALASAGRPAI